MNISNLMCNDSDQEKPSSANSSPSLARRHTVLSLLNDTDEVKQSDTKSKNGHGQDKKPSGKQPGKQKPRRYIDPPIYARRWDGHSESYHNVQDPSNHERLSFETGSRLGPSLSTITGVQPYGDLTRKVTEWLYGNIQRQSSQVRSNLEIEIKFGEIVVKRNSNQRLDLPVLTETILSPEFARSETSFKSEISDEQFTHVCSFLDALTSPTNRNTAVIARKNIKQRDLFFTGKLRVSYDERDNVMERIYKRKIADMMIFSPGDHLDLRISINEEVPVFGKQDVENSPPSMERAKNRTSYKTHGAQIDVTSVQQLVQRRIMLKELELELDAAVLTNLIDSFNSNADAKAMEQFEDLVQMELFNARILQRTLSRN